MNKAEFIGKLEQRLAVLTDEERRDILDEYEQHIDMKVMRGMSEEAAIADFGRLDELAADILEAYHVRADYAALDNGRTKKPGRWRIGRRGMAGASFSAGDDSAAGNREQDEPEEAGQGVMETLNLAYEGTWNRMKRLCAHIRDLCTRIGRTVQGGLKNTGSMLKAAASELAVFCQKPFQKRKTIGQETGDAEAAALKLTNKRTKREREMKEKSGITVGGLLIGFCRACAEAVLWCLKWMWNLFCIGAGLIFGFGSCLVVFVMGTLIVLLVLGYPLAGITIGWLGLTMCMVSATIGCFSLLILKRKRAARDTEEEEEMIHA